MPLPSWHPMPQVGLVQGELACHWLAPEVVVQVKVRGAHSPQQHSSSKGHSRPGEEQESPGKGWAEGVGQPNMVNIEGAPLPYLIPTHRGKRRQRRWRDISPRARPGQELAGALLLVRSIEDVPFPGKGSGPD